MVRELICIVSQKPKATSLPSLNPLLAELVSSEPQNRREKLLKLCRTAADYRALDVASADTDPEN